MALEYDLVIIGATAAARVAAIEAVNLQARVALILPHPANGQVHPQSDFYPYALAQIAKTIQTNRGQIQSPSSYPWKYAYTAIDRLEQESSPALLAAMGVDTIFGTGEFCRRPHLAFNINQRYLRARAYLIATGSVSDYPIIPGIQSAGYLTLDRLPSLVEREIPLRWAIIGAESIGVELAQTLAKLGCQVKLIVETEQILPYEDLDFANLIQAQLEADGVRVYLATIVTKVSQENRSKLVVMGDESIDVDEIFIALPDRPFIEPFNLAGVGIDHTDKGISIDNKLRTSHPQIYACGNVCGNVLGGYHSQSLTQYEAKIVVHNALNWRKIKVDYSSYDRLPWAVYTDPPLARVGMTIGAATNSPRRDLIILQKYLKTCPQAILNNITSGFCQIVVTRTGQILGAEIVGQNAPELIQILALAIQQKLKITDLTTFPCLSPSYTEFIYQAAQEWHTYNRNQKQQRQNGWLNCLCWWK
ncbi:NAD(P)/FAD-dependent oxidoreductase [Chamaesiphon sp. VAR_48_metabat_135_sub]|uniref:NAD(P)/FAD-dependent oxidoreductase n=1 Tax=Chamaesiphon sp. VAR_48_metabat_135_sub TaxID=2964699 RepID=UPI00286AC004|nr:NAD(P)/FAD-dependent oxidoreductase [Chamaesiphon sp. VAR_48_metabat_135_sub]